MNFLPSSNHAAPDEAVQRAIMDFERSSCSGPHAPDGLVLAPLLNHCVRNRMSFRLSHLGGGGYFLQRTFPS